MKKTILFAAVAALYALVGCQPIQTYINSYSYIVTYEDHASWGINEDAAAIYAELCQAVGCEPKVYSAPTTAPQDDAMKAACNSVISKNQELGKKSVYLRYYLIRQYVKMEPPRTEVLDTIAKYELGDALTTKYVYYGYVSNHTEAFDQFKQLMGGMRETNHDLYVECGQSYGIVQTAFKDFMDKKDPNTGAAAITARPWRDTADTDKFIQDGCDIIYDNNKDLKFVSDLRYAAYKSDFFNAKEITWLWDKTFKANFEVPADDSSAQ